MDKLLVVIDTSKRGGAVYICPVSEIHLDQVGAEDFASEFKQVNGIPSDADWAIVAKIQITGGM